jgi:hypothetical protein
MAWKYYDGSSKLELKVGDKVKTQLTPFKCSLGEMVENDDQVLYKKTWIVDFIASPSIILKSDNDRMVTTLYGFAVGQWIHHRIYKVQICG